MNTNVGNTGRAWEFGLSSDFRTNRELASSFPDHGDLSLFIIQVKSLILEVFGQEGIEFFNILLAPPGSKNCLNLAASQET